MKTTAFPNLLKELLALTNTQRVELNHQLRNLLHQVESQEIIESRLSPIPNCPHCGHNKIVRWGRASNLQRYRCKQCRTTFNALTNTPLARLRYKEKWLSYAEELAVSSSVRQSAKNCHIHRNTSFRWRHRFLTLPKIQQVNNLNGIVEVDETFFRESFKGQRKKLTRPAYKRGTPAQKRGLSKEQIAVLICRDRSKQTLSTVLTDDKLKAIQQILRPILAQDSIVCSDSSTVIKSAIRELGLVHRVVNLSAGVRVIGKIYHLQNVNAYDSRLKEWMKGFHGIATSYLPSYLGWRRLLEGYPTPRAILQAVLGIREQQQFMGT